MKNPTIKKGIKVVTVAGSSVLVVGAAINLFSAKSIKDAAMPLVAILVGVAAFNYAINDKVEVAPSKD